MSTRSNYITLLVGMPFTGKTTFLVEAAKRAKRPCLVLDNLLHPRYKEENYNVIYTIEELQKPITNNTVMVTNRMQYMECVSTILQYQSNITLALEDCKRFISDNPQNEIMNLVSDFRKFNIDVYFMYHALKFVPIKIATMSDVLVLFQTNESIDKQTLKSRFAKYEDVIATYNKINAIGKKTKRHIHDKEILFLTQKKM